MNIRNEMIILPADKPKHKLGFTIKESIGIGMMNPKAVYGKHSTRSRFIYTQDIKTHEKFICPCCFGKAVKSHHQESMFDWQTCYECQLEYLTMKNNYPLIKPLVNDEELVFEYDKNKQKFSIYHNNGYFDLVYSKPVIINNMNEMVEMCSQAIEESVFI